ncbi:DUF3800 domain-containing protein [Proteiniclasticum sp. QWL-01]|uniref:DUF3800 domain-containing protein n=1 Tax=Proteiniclasticum sp. QWL-01 TaxID=3036945 RepID=UPI002410C4B1|nr:DUF3800 domain-containing protein [Proteiniclasticum sp. QWL-01]WFF74036.1 hypothetical protein P6M73_06185 [Proteiniclasticum sp. QWL-01]
MKTENINYYPEIIDWIAFIDESGDHDIKNLLKKKRSGVSFDIMNSKRSNINFCISACIFYKSDIEDCKNLIMCLKNKYWDLGKFLYNDGLRRVCLHSRDIRRKTGPFNPRFINYDSFWEDLQAILKASRFTIVSSYTNKAKHVQKYKSPFPVYPLNMEFIIERLIKNFKGDGILVLESRGINNDTNLLRTIDHLLNHGNSFISKKDCGKIKGVYFNTKWSSDYQSSYFGIEIADLVVYSVSKFCKSGSKDPIFQAIESKLDNFPNYYGYGIKKFP